jgi:NAD(P)-dependent dehydrogenase (short-subunit alcohol dehydrogenase family)
MSVILVTGANKGIGYEAVKYLSQHKPNDTILLASRSIKNGNDAVEKMKSSVPDHAFSNVEVVQLDITDTASIEALVEQIRAKHGKLDVLVHNSAISNLNGDAMSPEVLEVNVRGARNTVEAFLPILPKHRGTVVLVSSEVGPWYMSQLPEPTKKALDDVKNVDWTKIEHWLKDWSSFTKGQESEFKWAPVTNMIGQAYCFSKGIVNAWTRSFAIQHPEIKVALVCPGYCHHPWEARALCGPCSTNSRPATFIKTAKSCRSK